MPINRAPWNALVDDDGSNLVGTVWNKDTIKTTILDPVDTFVSNGGVWIPYVAGWAGVDNIGPTMGNATMDSRYVQIGKWVDVAIVLRMGSTTTYGSSSYWTLSLPFPALMVGTRNTFRAGAVSAAGTIVGGLMGYAIPGGTTAVYTISHTGALWNPTTPFTWAANAMFSIRGSYEIA